MEVCIHGHVQIRCNSKSCGCPNNIFVFGRTYKDACNNFLWSSFGSGVHYFCNTSDIFCTQPVDDCAISFARRKTQHSFAQGSNQNLWLRFGANTKTETINVECVVLLSDFFSGESIIQEPNHISNLLVRLFKWNAVPPLHDHVAGRTNTYCESSGCSVCKRCHRLCKTSRATRICRNNCSSQTQAWLPRSS